MMLPSRIALITKSITVIGPVYTEPVG